MRHISVTIPTYEMKGLGKEYLKHSFDILNSQTFKDFDIIISDHSKDEVIQNLCEEYKDRLDIKYFRNAGMIGSSSANLNNAISKAQGKIIKILFQDDFLFDEHSLKHIADNFDIEKDGWLATACTHTNNGKDFFLPFHPHYNDKIHLGNNTISSPSVIAIRNSDPLLFDEKLIWLMDCDYYKRCYMKYGELKITNDICTVNRSGAHQVTNTLATKNVRKTELRYVKAKFKKRKSPKIILPSITLVAVSSIKIKNTIRALEHSMERISFGRVLLISHEKPEGLNLDIEFKQCKRITSLDEYSKFMLYELPQYIDTDFALVIQHDGYVVRPEKWDNAFLQYDYIGAPWAPKTHFTKSGTEVRVGNGGFSLRSKKLLHALGALNLSFSDIDNDILNEDGVLCNYFRKELENYGIIFAPVDIATRFSLENKNDDITIEPFGFHRMSKFIPFAERINYWLSKLTS